MKNLVAVFFIAVGLTAQATPLTLQIPITGQSPVIDGNLNESAWSVAAAASGFSSTGDEWVASQTSVLLTTDGQKLYFAFKCQLSGVPEAEVRESGSIRIFEDESVELFMAPDESSPVYYHLAFNAVGSHYSARCGKGRDTSWQPPLEIAVGKFEEGWILEGSLPLDTVNTTASPAKKWKMNFGRNCHQPIKVSSSWTGQADFNNSDLFGDVMPSTVAGASFELIRINDGKAELMLRNSGRSVAEFHVALSLSEKRDITVNPESSFPLTLDFGRQKRNLSMTINAPGVVFGKTCLANISANVFTLRPERYYYSPGQKELVLTTEYFPAGTDRFVCMLSDGIRSLRQFDVKAGTDRFEVSLQGLTIGRYLIVVDCIDRQGKVLVSDTRVFFIADLASAALPPQAKFTLNNRVFMMNGNPFFPFMRNASNTAISPLEQDAFNVCYGTGAKANSPKFRDCGLPAKLIRQPFLAYVLPADEKTFKGIDAEQSREGNFLFCRLRYEIGIKLCNEKLEELNKRTEYRKFYRYLREKFPAAPPVSIQFDGSAIGELNDFTEVCDIMEVASWFSSYARNPIKNMIVDLKKTRAIAGSKPLLWWIGVSIPYHTYRNAENLRAATYLALMYSANGIVYHMGHEGIPPERTRLWSVFHGLGEEMDFLYPLLTAGRRLDDGAVTVDSAAINLIAFVHGKKLYIIAVNLADEPVDTVFELQTASGVIEMPFERNRSLTLKSGRFSDSFTRHEPHVYVLPSTGFTQ